jgi:hypothetical protein
MVGRIRAPKGRHIDGNNSVAPTGLKHFWFIISVGLHPRLKTIALFEGFIEKSRRLFIISVGLHPRLKTIALFEGFIEKSRRFFIISVGLHPRLRTIALFEGFIEKSTRILPSPTLVGVG